MTNITQQKLQRDYLSTLKYVFLSMRPEQWIKNFLVFAALVFSKNMFILSQDIKAFAGLIIFCMIMGCSYLINDLFSLEKDKLHPNKSQRPVH